MEQKQINLQKMVFIYNAVQSGWVVKKKSNNTFEFRKTKTNLIKEVDLDDNQLINFIDKNRKIDEFLNNIY
tara:strand:- start:160 stop:372 length:213 start_codon:yes stop_codon:yes gene_type:complete